MVLQVSVSGFRLAQFSRASTLELPLHHTLKAPSSQTLNVGMRYFRAIGLASIAFARNVWQQHICQPLNPEGHVPLALALALDVNINAAECPTGQKRLIAK